METEARQRGEEENLKYYWAGSELSLIFLQYSLTWTPGSSQPRSGPRGTKTNPEEVLQFWLKDRERGLLTLKRVGVNPYIFFLISPFSSTLAFKQSHSQNSKWGEIHLMSGALWSQNDMVSSHLFFLDICHLALDKCAVTEGIPQSGVNKVPAFQPKFFSERSPKTLKVCLGKQYHEIVYELLGLSPGSVCMDQTLSNIA